MKQISADSAATSRGSGPGKHRAIGCASDTWDVLRADDVESDRTPQNSTDDSSAHLPAISRNVPACKQPGPKSAGRPFRVSVEEFRFLPFTPLEVLPELRAVFQVVTDC